MKHKNKLFSTFAICFFIVNFLYLANVKGQEEVPVPDVSGPSIVPCGETATLIATGSTGEYIWFSDPEGENEIGEGSTFVTPPIIETTTFYVAAADECLGVLDTLVFTNCGSTGHLGPTQAQVNATYAGTPLEGEVTVISTGIQVWTVPGTGTYLIEAFGARGGHGSGAVMGGDGAMMSGEFQLTGGQQLEILVGQRGIQGSNNNAGGGGGGTYVVQAGGTTIDDILIIAGGGGGGGSDSWTDNAVGGTTELEGTVDAVGLKTYMGQFGTEGHGSCAGQSQGGGIGSNGGGAGGFLTSGNDCGQTGHLGMPGEPGNGYLDGGAGADGSGGSDIGGYGGGSSTPANLSNSNGSGGAGGGFSGGAGGSRLGDRIGGGGGGSYNAGTNQFNQEAFNNGHGYVIITPLQHDCLSDLVPITIDITPIPADAQNTGPYCPDEQIELSTVHVPSASYTWEGPGGWTGDVQQPTISDINPSYSGTYTVTVETPEGCVSTSSTEVTVNPFPSADASNTGPYCAGDNIELSTPDEFGGSFSWTGPGGYASNLQNPVRENSNISMSGTYSLEVVSEHGCISTSGTNVVVNPVPTANATNTGPYCIEETISLTTPNVEGAIYQWEGPNNFSSENRNPIIPNADFPMFGTYHVTVTNEFGCTNTSSTEVIIDPGPSIELTAEKHPSCHNDNDGIIQVVLDDGVPPYHINWGDSFTVTENTLFSIPDLEPGDYTITVTDSNNCFAEESVELINPEELVSYIVSLTDQHCLTFGTVEISGHGGTYPYSYTWPENAGGAFHNAANQLEEGQYYVTVTDFMGCETIQEIIINDVGEFEATSSIVHHPDCHGDVDGQILIQVVEGEPNYTITWGIGIITTEEPTYLLTGLSAGEYNITVSDTHGCNEVFEDLIIEPDLMVAEATVSSNYNGLDISCYNAKDGSAIVNVTGGTPPYLYQWCENANYQTTKEIENLDEGTYHVTVTDINNCETSSFVNVTDTERFVSSMSIENDVSCFDANNGMATVHVDGGVGPYKYIWSPSADRQATKTGVNLTQGRHYVTVTDLNECETVNSVLIAQPNPIDVQYQFERPSCIGNNDGYLEFSVTGGTEPYLYYFNGVLLNQDYLDNIKQGYYTIEIKDRNNCLKRVGPIEIKDIDVSCITVPDAFSPNDDGINDVWEIENIYKYPDAIIKVFNRWGQEVYQGRGSDEPWDGTYNGKPLPTATYVYFISLYEGSESITGHVTIVY